MFVVFCDYCCWKTTIPMTTKIRLDHHETNVAEKVVAEESCESSAVAFVRSWICTAVMAAFQ